MALQPDWLMPIYDTSGKLIGASAPNGQQAFFAGGSAGGATVVSSNAPNNADGRPDGTVYVQAP